MQTDSSPTWKTVLKGIPWFIGILAYGVLITIASALLYQGTGIILAGVSWIALLVLPGGALIENNHKAIGWMLVGMAVMILALFITGGLLIAGANPLTFHAFGRP